MTGLCVEKGDRRGIPFASPVYPRQRGGDVQNLRQRRQIPLRNGGVANFAVGLPPPSPLCATADYGTIYLRDTSACDYLLVTRSCRGRGGPSERVSDIHASARAHPAYGCTQYAIGRGHEDASDVRDGHLCRDGATYRCVLSSTRSRIDQESEFHLHP